VVLAHCVEASDDFLEDGGRASLHKFLSGDETPRCSLELDKFKPIVDQSRAPEAGNKDKNREPAEASKKK
jgi:hypothetical protein